MNKSFGTDGMHTKTSFEVLQEGSQLILNPMKCIVRLWSETVSIIADKSEILQINQVHSERHVSRIIWPAIRRVLCSSEGLETC
jgi:hypothetical protein